MSEINNFLSGNWFKVSLLIGIIVLIISAQDFSGKIFKKILSLVFLIVFFAMCVWFGGYVYGSAQVFFMLIACVYFSSFNKK
jgi:Ca2+/Na+ antiporter